MSRGDLLRDIFGDNLHDLSESELAAAEKVLDYFYPSFTKEMEVTSQNILDACKYALENAGKSWDGIMLNRSRKRWIVEYRFAVSLIFFRRSPGTQEYKTKMLGGFFDRTTLIKNIGTASDLVQYDESFRMLYAGLSESVNEYLNKLKNED